MLWLLLLLLLLRVELRCLLRLLYTVLLLVLLQLVLQGKLLLLQLLRAVLLLRVAEALLWLLAGNTRRRSTRDRPRARLRATRTLELIGGRRRLCRCRSRKRSRSRNRRDSIIRRRLLLLLLRWGLSRSLDRNRRGTLGQDRADSSGRDWRTLDGRLCDGHTRNAVRLALLSRSLSRHGRLRLRSRRHSKSCRLTRGLGNRVMPLLLLLLLLLMLLLQVVVLGLLKRWLLETLLRCWKVLGRSLTALG